MKKILLLALLVVLAGGVARAQMNHEHTVPVKTGNADADFLRGMIPHHEGAIKMADEVLQNGKDPEVKMLAQDIIRAQQDEIKWMKEWLAKHDASETAKSKTP